MPAIPAPQITTSAVSGVMGATLPRMPGVYDRGVVSMYVRANARQRLREIARRAMIERGLEPEFSPAARAEAQALTGQADGGDRMIRDARDLLWCSIDNDDSRDLDQLTVAVDAGGASRVLVAVADVDAGVPQGSALDTHASTNTTSVYTAAEVVPMLPERLSTDLTSLNAAENRLALVVDLTVDADGAVAAGEIYRERVRNRMIAANGVTAKFLDARGVASLRRVLRTPERWDRIVVLAAEHGGRLPASPDAAALAAFLLARREADPERFPDLSLAVVKLLGKGEYALARPGHEPAGHFALAVRDYTHATAPNRRFPDLITQRLVKAALADRAPAYEAEELDALARHCSEQEDDAAKVERQVRKSAAALLLEHRIGERFDALVTGAAEKGTWVRITRPPVEGRLVRGADGLDVGDRVQVLLKSTDVERGFIDFERA